MRRMLSLAFLACAAGVPSGWAAAGDASPVSLTIETALQLKSPGQPKPQPVAALVEMEYRLEPSEDGLVLTIDRLHSRYGNGETTISETRLDARAGEFTQGGTKPTRIESSTAYPALKELLSAFGQPLARIKLDAQGGETGRELLVPADSVLAENGVVDNALLFFSAIPADAAQWEAPARLPLGNGQFATGTLRFTRAGADAGASMPVAVEGVLRANGPLATAQIKEGIYEVKGLQTYDPARRVWTGGEWNVGVRLALEAGGHEAGTATGTMLIRRQVGAPPTSAGGPTAK